jgi:hypothetical protein
MFEFTIGRNQGHHPPLPDPSCGPAGGGLDPEALALPDEAPDDGRAELACWLAEFPPADRLEHNLVEQLAVAALEKKRARRVRTALLAEKVRTAAYRFDEANRQQVQRYEKMLITSPAEAVAGLASFAAGTRHLIGRWERLKAVFALEQTWYGQDRDEAMRLQGVRPGKEHLAESETAYVTYLYCLMAQPDPRPLEMELREIGLPELMPKTFQDHAIADWLPPHARCRELLVELIEHELTALRAREAWLSTNIEEPARRAALERARVLEGSELAVLRNEQIHDQLFHRAYQALRRSHGQRRSEPPQPRAAVAHPEPRAARPPLLTDAPPQTQRETQTVFFDYHASRRAARESALALAAANAAATPPPAETPPAEGTNGRAL